MILEQSMTKRILIVEDEEDNRRIVRDLLQASNYQLTEVENGEDAIAAVKRERPDLILMDLHLPLMDGYEATRRMKADPSLSSIPVVAVTSSYVLGGAQEKARAAGFDGFIPKPYSPRQLLAKIRQLLP
jgi:two-component system cell cycle response regulator DivK